MGYDTTYDIKFDPWPCDAESIPRSHEEFVDELQLDGGYIEPNDFENGWISLGTTTWYRWLDDLLRVSAEYPESVIAIRGNGDHEGDQWIAYAKGGRYVVHKREEWVPPPFNEDDLLPEES
jgi:hypothetical protein